VKHKGELDRRVSRELHIPVVDVSRITSEFIRQIRELIVEAGFAIVDGLGALKADVVYRKRAPANYVYLPGGTFKKGEKTKVTELRVGPSYIRVHFKKAAKLKEMLNDAFKEDPKLFEKYAVDEGTGDQKQLEKQASKGCPECGKKPTVHGSVLLCPVHGSKPFETPPEEPE